MKKRYWKKTAKSALMESIDMAADVKMLLKEVEALEAERARWSEDRGSSEALAEALAEALGRIEQMKTVQAETEAELNKLRVEHAKLRDTHSKIKKRNTEYRVELGIKSGPKPNGEAQHDAP